MQVINTETNTSENIAEIAPTLNDFFLLFSQYTPPPGGVDSQFTICDKVEGTNKTQSIDNAYIKEIISATCGFILFEENSTASCSDLQCGDGVAVEEAAFSTLASWNLKWCPGSIGNPSQVSWYPQCCFHPAIRQLVGKGLWDCLWTYVKGQ